MLTGSGCYTSPTREWMTYFGRSTHLVLNEENVIRHLFCIVYRKAQREILGECNDLLSCLICGCSCFLCASTGRTGDSRAGKDHPCIWFAASRSFVPSSLTVACTALGHSAGASECCRRGWVILGLFESCSEGAKFWWVLRTHQCWAKKAVRCRVPTNKVKPRGQKHECLRNSKQISVFLNRSLEIYFQGGIEGTSPCILSITAYAQLPQRRKWGGGGRHCWSWGRTGLWGLQSTRLIHTHLWYAFNAKQWTSCTKHYHCWKCL